MEAPDVGQTASGPQLTFRHAVVLGAVRLRATAQPPAYQSCVSVVASCAMSVCIVPQPFAVMMDLAAGLLRVGFAGSAQRLRNIVDTLSSLDFFALEDLEYEAVSCVCYMGQ